MAEFPRFKDFYRAANGGREPFPWQRRLADLVVDKGWPSEIGVPTGLGKTGCIDIAVWALAARLHGHGGAPTRIWYVVNRRLLVDFAWTRGMRLATLLGDPACLSTSWADATAKDQGAVAAVARALLDAAAMGSEEGPLHVTRLRGGAEIGARTPDPSQPTLVLSTVAMFASRWLFRGYGSSTSLRPVDAALAGIDTLVLLDEAHLALPVINLAQAAAECDPGDPSRLLPHGRSRAVFVALTATGERAEHRFDLDADDRAHPIVTERIDAPKPVTLIETTEKQLASALAEQARELIQGAEAPSACVVFTNTPATAREVFAELSKQKVVCDARDLVLITGRMREREAERVRSQLLDPLQGVPSGRDGTLARPVIVVATQTLEVGADLDFDALVSETAGVRALIQRLGRLNRLGKKSHARAVLCHPRDRKKWPVYGEEQPKVWERLVDAAATENEIDLRPSRVNEILGEPADRPARVGELLPSHLWEWVKTSSPPPGEAPVELFFDGFETPGRISLVWRASLPEPGVRLVPAVSADESVELQLSDELRKALTNRALEHVCRLTHDSASLERVTLAALRPGDVVVLPADVGLYDEYGWNPDAAQPVLDVSMLRAPVLILAPSALENLLGTVPPEIGEALRVLVAADGTDEDLDTLPEDALARDLLAGLRSCIPSSWLSAAEWNTFLEGLSTNVARPLGHAPYLLPLAKGHLPAWARVRADALEELSFTASATALVQHVGAVGEAAERIARALRFPDDLVGAVKRAGELHDLGKADPRFQRWLDPQQAAEEPLAKSSTPPHLVATTRKASGWPQGGRHELLSARLAREALDLTDTDVDRDLVVHLVLSHHGHGRPLVSAVEDPYPVRVSHNVHGKQVSVSGDLSVPDWTQPRRFRALCERYGYWGLALLEAILRQADHAVSSATEVL